uniref:NADH-ubiquinone oxidoreductase chain 5 n=1 Tax=Habroteleia persimilis TaxID=2496286 RepID=A0A3Q8UAA3_9HYME|nr:NADH dehydrogenase subunit 5 [Habroteleia persimilis]
MLVIYLNFSIMLFLFSIFMLLMMMKFLLLKMKIFIEINFFMLNTLNFSMMLYFDYKTFMFMMVVMLISSMIIIYSIEYMMMDIFKIRFIYLLFMFIISMLLMICGQNLLLLLLGWDGLGLISYCLVIYYNNWSSYNAGMLTILTNRLGDIGLLISIGIFSILGDWNFLMLMINNNKILFFMLVLSGITKSAQIPFSSWLPKAMAAPTPISALVHSSTLVTAGVYLFYRLSNMMNFNSVYLIFISLLTMFFSGMVASFEFDLKKIIALSTLSQLGLMMFSLFIGLKSYMFFHLVIHAMFKSLLFMCAGLLLHSMFNNQDIRYLGVMNYNYLFTLVMFNISNLALCGFPFLSGFYSKDLILELSNLNMLNYLILLMFYMSIFLTIMYSFRLIYYMIMNYMKFFSMMTCFDNMLMNLSMLIIFFFSIIGGSLYSWMIYSSLNMIYLSMNMKMLFNMMIFMNMFFMLLFLLKLNFNTFNYMKFYMFMNSLWFMNYFSNLLIKNVLIYGMNIFKLMEKGWIEYLSIKFIYLYLLNFMKLEKIVLNIIIKIMIIYLWLILIYMY